MSTGPDARDVRGTPEWQAAHISAAEGVNLRAQVALGLGVELRIDTSGLEPGGGQLDLLDNMP